MGEFGIGDRLLIGFREGDHRCFAIVFHLYYRSLLALALRRTKDLSAAKDIVQDSFILLWERHEVFESITSIYATLHNAVVQGCGQHHRHVTMQRRQRRKLTAAFKLQLERATIHTESEFLVKALAAVQMLPKGCREVINLTYVVGMDEEQAAATLNVTVSAVRSQRFRAIYLLKKMLLKDQAQDIWHRHSLLNFINADSLIVFMGRYFQVQPKQLRYRGTERGASAAMFPSRIWWGAASVLLTLAVAAGLTIQLHRSSLYAAAPIPTKQQSTGLSLIDSLQKVAPLWCEDSASQTDNRMYVTKAKEIIGVPGKKRPAPLVGFTAVATTIGAMYRVVLDDGTKVWLNAVSSLRFPTHFYGHERRVELMGEAYFEVAAEDPRPFIVVADGMQTATRDAAFNITAYSEDPRAVTPVRGVVEMKKGGQRMSLQAGQVLTWNNTVYTFNQIDSRIAILWTEEKFSTHRASFETVMHRISRWYGVTVRYPDGAPPSINVEIINGKYLPIENLLSVLQGYGVQFKLQGNELLVTSPKQSINRFNLFGT